MDFYEVMENASTKRLLTYLKKYRPIHNNVQRMIDEHYENINQLEIDIYDEWNYVKELLSKREHIEKEN